MRDLDDIPPLLDSTTKLPTSSALLLFGIAPILLGQGIRLYDNPVSTPIRLHRVGEDPDRESVGY